MPSSKNYWTTRSGDGWAVRREGAKKATSRHDSQSDAWSETRRLARGSGGEAFLQGRNGQIRARNTYGEDPFPPKG